jgi:hypothetical protein
MKAPASISKGKPSRAIGERGFRFCYYVSNGEPLLEVRGEARAEDVREQAYMLMETVSEVLATRIGEGSVVDGADAVLDVGTAYILRFAVEAAAAMVGSLDVDSP